MESYNELYVNQLLKMRRSQSWIQSVVLYLFCSVVLCILPVDGRIASSGSRGHDFKTVDAVADFGSNTRILPIGAGSNRATSHESRRRLRRSPEDVDFRAFRMFLQSFRKARLSASLDIGSDEIVKRNTELAFTERGSTGNIIASKVGCGECKLTKQWIPVTKRGCRTNFILAPTCMGMCETWEVPDIHPPYITTQHHVCRPKKIEYRKIRLRKCQPGVNNFYIMPFAQNCACTKCKSKNTACRPLL